MEALKLVIACGILAGFVQNVRAVPTAKINNSDIIGKTVQFQTKTANQYLGVPYAQPPVGPLRFQKTQPIQNYPTKLEAFNNPPACLQHTEKPFPWYINSTHKSEDCLFLNIWTPADASPSNKKAVMYWMHGGGHRYGSIIDPDFNGARLAALGDIIVVTVNYRLGYFGFLTSNSLDAPGNAGIWDVLEGLKWVNKYIGAFGGDVSKITVAGEGAGAEDVGIFSISPLAKGLYARQIMQTSSPASRRHDNNKQNLALSQQLANYVGCANDSFTIDAHPKEVVQCLKGIDSERISKAEYELEPTAGYRLLPQFGDEIFGENPRVSIINGDFRCTDLLIGNNKDVGSSLLTTLGYEDYFGFFGEKNSHVNRTLGREFIEKASAAFAEPKAIQDYYLPESMTDDSDYGIRTQTYTALGDLAFLCPTVYYAEKCAEQEKSVYFYYFTHRPSNSPWAKWMGVTLFDLPKFVFGRPIYNSDYQTSEYFLSSQIVDIWSNFVKNGRPAVSWPKYSKESRTYRNIGPTFISDYNQEIGPHGANCEFLKSHFGF